MGCYRGYEDKYWEGVYEFGLRGENGDIRVEEKIRGKY